MSRNDRKIFRLLVCVLMVSALCFSVFAAEDSLLTLKAPQCVLAGEEVAITVAVDQADVVGDGKLVVTYDAGILTYVNAEAGSAWGENELVLSDNGTVEGRVIVSFAGEVNAQAGALVVLNFTAVGGGTTEVAVESGESYISDYQGSLEAETQITVAYFDENCDGGDTCPSAKFTDVNYTGAYHTAIDYMVANGYMNGTSATTFAPEMKMDRAMMVTVMYRAAGCPEVEGTVPYTDVDENAYYYDALIWATQNGIAKGMTATTFAPKLELSREQSVTFLYRFAGYMGMDVSAAADLSGYTDAGDVRAYALEAMQWAVGEGIVKGMTATTLEPAYVAPRVQVCVMFFRLLSE